MFSGSIARHFYRNCSPKYADSFFKNFQNSKTIENFENHCRNDVPFFANPITCGAPAYLKSQTHRLLLLRERESQIDRAKPPGTHAKFNAKFLSTHGLDVFYTCTHTHINQGVYNFLTRCLRLDAVYVGR